MTLVTSRWHPEDTTLKLTLATIRAQFLKDRGSTSEELRAFLLLSCVLQD